MIKTLKLLFFFFFFRKKAPRWMDETRKYLLVCVFTLKLHRGSRGQGSSSASFILTSELSAGHTVGLIHMGLEEELKSGFKT